METKFQTSFIPKKPMPNNVGNVAQVMQHKLASRGTSSIYMTLATIIFVASLLAVGGAYAAKIYFINSQENYKQELALREKDFDIEKISVLKAQSTKIVLAKQVINNHMAISKLFSVISLFTAENVRFLTMELAVPAGTAGPIQLTMAGYGKDFASLAFQSDVLNSLEKYNLRSVIKNPIISSPTVNTNSTVTFGFSAQVDAASFSYSKNLGTSN